jgi:hypothetical protein
MSFPLVTFVATIAALTGQVVRNLRLVAYWMSPADHASRYQHRGTVDNGTTSSGAKVVF